MIYYKGNVINKGFCYGQIYKLVFDHVGIDDKTYILNWNTSYELNDYFKHRKDDYEKINTSLRDICRSVGDKKELDKLFLSALKPDINDKSGKNIFYEKIYDTEGNCYGKELLTGLIFPIRYDYDDYEIKYDYETKDAGVASIKYEYSISITPKIISPPDTRIECLIVGEEVANQEELSLYYKKYGKKIGLFKNDYIKEIKRMANSNYLGDNITFTSTASIVVKEKIKEPTIIAEMQELEYLLMKLKSGSEEDYNKINKEDERLLNQDNDALNINPLSIKSIIDLQSKVKLSFILNGGDKKTINDFLEKQVGLYFENILNHNNSNTELSISDLDIIEEGILVSNNFTVVDKSKILRLIALAYFFEIYENIDTIDPVTLENSYITNNIKRILLVIISLKEEGIIDYSPELIQDDTDINELVNIIKKIKFNTNIDVQEKGMTIIKRIQ